MILPEVFPSDWNGELTCSSCHQIHQPVHGSLRGQARGRGFCLSCHSKDFFDRMADGGQSLTLSGHLDARTPGITPQIDPFSVQCMSCHEEQADSRVRIDARGVMRHAQNGINHPIGITYAAAESFGGYRPRAMLDPAIELPGGRVSCVSCHQGYSVKHGAVRIVQRSGGLCLECHQL